MLPTRRDDSQMHQGDGRSDQALQIQPSGSSTNFDLYYVAPSDITNSECGDSKFKTTDALDDLSELNRVFLNL